MEFIQLKKIDKMLLEIEVLKKKIYSRKNKHYNYKYLLKKEMEKNILNGRKINKSSEYTNILQNIEKNKTEYKINNDLFKKKLKKIKTIM
jgi:hypothetical protein